MSLFGDRVSRVWVAVCVLVLLVLAVVLQGYLARLYGGVVALVTVVLLLARRYRLLAVFLVVVVLVAWVVFMLSALVWFVAGVGVQVFGVGVGL